MEASTAFFLGLLLGILLAVSLICGKKITKECPVCKQARESQEKRRRNS